MPSTGYTVSRARRFIAGNWCAQKKNQGKLPCLQCRGRGTLPPDAGGCCFQGCPGCEATGYADEKVWMLWFKLWVYTNVKGLVIDDAIFHGGHSLPPP